MECLDFQEIQKNFVVCPFSAMFRPGNLGSFGFYFVCYSEQIDMKNSMDITK